MRRLPSREGGRWDVVDQGSWLEACVGWPCGPVLTPCWFAALLRPALTVTVFGRQWFLVSRWMPVLLEEDVFCRGV